MLLEEDILDLGFTKEDYSTAAIQYYIFIVSRATDIQSDAHNDYILKVDNADDNPHQLSAKLRLGSHYNLNTNGWMGTFTDKDHLYDVLMKMIRWDITH
jgi:hypothetical protein